MNVLLLGNGLDLYYNLPTKYSNFLHVSNYLLTHPNLPMNSIGDILSQDELHAVDPFVKECYEAHKPIYDNTLIDANKIRELISIVRNNIWFSYLHKSFNQNLGWIDFEKEIAFVLSCFEQILPREGIVFTFEKDDAVRYVVTTFNFLIETTSDIGSFAIGANEIKKEFCLEHPFGSGHFEVSKEKVASYLANELHGLSTALKLYLSCFVENTIEPLQKQKAYERIPIFKHISQTITFNYTNTYEKLYLTENASHIHGSLRDCIVLGVNPDAADNIGSVDTSFIEFKKYFQRALYGTDHAFWRWIADLKRNKQTYRLIVMGHSLDVTDKDIILDVFRYANEIIILYHNDEAKAAYIANLVKLYGKEGFDSLSKEQSLTFLSLNADLQKLAQKISDEARELLIESVIENIRI